MTSPEDHLLFKIYDEFGWGDPFGYEKQKTCAAINEHNRLTNPTDTRFAGRPRTLYSHRPCLFRYSEEANDYPENLFDLLGEYTFTDPAREGRITVFEEGIKRIGLLYYVRTGKYTRKGRAFYVNIVREIAAWHALGHWVIHWMPGSNGSRWNPATYCGDDQTRDLHEGLAQLFTYYAIINSKHLNAERDRLLTLPGMVNEGERQRSEYLSVFAFMLRGQAGCYHRFHDILGHKNFSWRGCFIALQMLRNETDVRNISLDSFLERLLPIVNA